MLRAKVTRLNTRSIFWTLGLVCLFCLFQGGLFATLPQKTDKTAPAIEKKGQSIRSDPKRVMGVTKSDCKKCHPSEVAHWMKTRHFRSSDTLFKFDANAAKYATAVGLTADTLLTDSICADCHATKAVIKDAAKVISSVSCESCHGAAGGKNGWLIRHQSYHDTRPTPRSKETAKHHKQRLKDIDAAGMIRSDNIYEQAKSCFGCHMIGDEKLLAVGHKAESIGFEFVSWSSGEVRHNFFIDKTKNAAAPTLWANRTSGSSKNRRRVKFVVGTLVQLELALRHRAKATDPFKFGGIAAAASGRLVQISGLVGTQEIQATVALATPLQGLLFGSQPTDAKVYGDVADKVAEQARKFAKAHDGSKLMALDAMIEMLPPRFSQRYKEKNP